jgi:dTDP-4-amino-4,6-dideoxygalactose transaminase
VLIEDCALSLLSSDRGTPLGTTGDARIFCLYKTLPVPHGGALSLSDDAPQLGRHELPRPAPLSSTSSHILSSLLANFELRAGAPGRMVRHAVLAAGRRTLDAAQVRRVGTGTAHFERRHAELGMSRLARRLARVQDPASIVERRRRNYAILLDGLRDRVPPLFDTLPGGVSPLFYPLVVERKAAVLRALWARGIEAVDFWSTSHPSCNLEEFPEVAWLRRSVIEVPCHQDLSRRRTIRVLDAVRESIDATRAAGLHRGGSPARYS